MKYVYRSFYLFVILSLFSCKGGHQNVKEEMRYNNLSHNCRSLIITDSLSKSDVEEVWGKPLDKRKNNFVLPEQLNLLEYDEQWIYSEAELILQRLVFFEKERVVYVFETWSDW